MRAQGFGIGDIAAAFGLLTRLPVPVQAPPRPDAAWAWPLAGAGVAALGAALAAAAMALGLPAEPAAALALGLCAMLTGGLHEDGLADCADGFFGGHTRERRLVIMKDSAIGSFGALALVVVTLIRWSALAAVIAAGHWGVVIAIGALSRAPMAVLIHALPNARGSGLSKAVGRPSRRAVAGAGGVAVVLVLATAGWAGFGMILMVAIATLWLARLAQARIGGQTGDVLGAAQQLAEAAALCAAAMWVA